MDRCRLFVNDATCDGGFHMTNDMSGIDLGQPAERQRRDPPTLNSRRRKSSSQERDTMKGGSSLKAAVGPDHGHEMFNPGTENRMATPRPNSGTLGPSG
jgi:hypothetical protein